MTPTLIFFFLNQLSPSRKAHKLKYPRATYLAFPLAIHFGLLVLWVTEVHSTLMLTLQLTQIPSINGQNQMLYTEISTIV